MSLITSSTINIQPKTFMMHDIVDLERFPINALDNEQGQALVLRCRSELANRGLFNLDGFLRRDALGKAADEVKPIIESNAFTHKRRHNVYFLPDVPGLPPDHPALRQFETINHTICSDQIPDSVLMRLYAWPPFAAFLAAVMEIPSLHVMADPLAAVNVMTYYDGEALNWHFDRSEFTTTLLLQSSDHGGEFQYCTGLRSDVDPNYDAVGRFLQGDQSEAVTLPLLPGTLSVFRGKNTVHRVTPVEGVRERIIAVFSYYQESDVTFTPEERIGFFGRAK